MILFRRYLGFFIDLLLPIFITGFVFYINYDVVKSTFGAENIIIYFKTFAFFLYLITVLTSIFVTENGTTLGQSITNILPVRENGESASKKAVLLKEMFIAFMLSGILLQTSGWWIPIVLFYVPIGKVQSLNAYRVAIDLPFKHAYVHNLQLQAVKPPS